ncbi:MAG: hypothetical protein R3C26_17865 [Calditrichia bacterium]
MGKSKMVPLKFWKGRYKTSDGVLFLTKGREGHSEIKSYGFVSNAMLTTIDPYDWQPAEAGPNGAMPDSEPNTAAWQM